MRAGDLVRFREVTFHGSPKTYSEWKIGLLLEYEPYQKIATVNYDGEQVLIRASDVQVYQQAKRERKN
jgi:hypothetical protein